VAHLVPELELPDDEFGVHAELNMVGAKRQGSFKTGDRRLVFSLVIRRPAEPAGDCVDFTPLRVVDDRADRGRSRVAS